LESKASALGTALNVAKHVQIWRFGLQPCSQGHLIPENLCFSTYNFWKLVKI